MVNPLRPLLNIFFKKTEQSEARKKSAPQKTEQNKTILSWFKGLFIQSTTSKIKSLKNKLKPLKNNSGLFNIKQLKEIEQIQTAVTSLGQNKKILGRRDFYNIQSQLIHIKNKAKKQSMIDLFRKETRKEPLNHYNSRKPQQYDQHLAITGAAITNVLGGYKKLYTRKDHKDPFLALQFNKLKQLEQYVEKIADSDLSDNDLKELITIVQDLNQKLEAQAVNDPATGETRINNVKNMMKNLETLNQFAMRSIKKRLFSRTANQKILGLKSELRAVLTDKTFFTEAQILKVKDLRKRTQKLAKKYPDLKFRMDYKETLKGIDASELKIIKQGNIEKEYTKIHDINDKNLGNILTKGRKNHTDYLLQVKTTFQDAQKLYAGESFKKLSTSLLEKIKKNDLSPSDILNLQEISQKAKDTLLEKILNTPLEKGSLPVQMLQALNKLDLVNQFASHQMTTGLLNSIKSQSKQFEILTKIIYQDIEEISDPTLKKLLTELRDNMGAVRNFWEDIEVEADRIGTGREASQFLQRVFNCYYSGNPTIICANRIIKIPHKEMEKFQNLISKIDIYSLNSKDQSLIGDAGKKGISLIYEFHNELLGEMKAPPLFTDLDQKKMSGLEKRVNKEIKEGKRLGFEYMQQLQIDREIEGSSTEENFVKYANDLTTLSSLMSASMQMYGNDPVLSDLIKQTDKHMKKLQSFIDKIDLKGLKVGSHDSVLALIKKEMAYGNAYCPSLDISIPQKEIQYMPKLITLMKNHIKHKYPNEIGLSGLFKNSFNTLARLENHHENLFGTSDFKEEKAKIREEAGRLELNEILQQYYKLSITKLTSDDTAIPAGHF